MAEVVDLGQGYFKDITIVGNKLKQFIPIKRNIFGIESYVLATANK